MKYQYEHSLTSSFYLWFENHLLTDNVQAYSTGNANNFTAVTVNEVPNDYIAYQGEFRQLVAEQNVHGPNSGYFVGGNFVTGDYNQTNNYIDYYNGRIIVPFASGSGLAITANSTVKEINTYIADDGEETIILHSEFRELGQSDNYLYNQTSLLDEDIYILPACFISLANSHNKELCFGGEEETINRIRVMVIATDNYYLDGILGTFKDQERAHFANINFESFPYGQFFSLKTFPYNYVNLVDSQTESDQTKNKIIKVTASKLTNDIEHESLGKDLKIGFLEFDISTYRFPRI